MHVFYLYYDHCTNASVICRLKRLLTYLLTYLERAAHHHHKFSVPIQMGCPHFRSEDCVRSTYRSTDGVRSIHIAILRMKKLLLLLFHSIPASSASIPLAVYVNCSSLFCHLANERTIPIRNIFAFVCLI